MRKEVFGTDSHTAKLTRERIEEIRKYGTHVVPFEERHYVVIELCDLALRGLSAPSETAPLIEALKRITEWGYDEPNSALIARVALKKADPQAMRRPAANAVEPVGSAPCVERRMEEFIRISVIGRGDVPMDIRKAAEQIVEGKR